MTSKIICEGETRKSSIDNSMLIVNLRHFLRIPVPFTTVSANYSIINKMVRKVLVVGVGMTKVLTSFRTTVYSINNHFMLHVFG